MKMAVHIYCTQRKVENWRDKLQKEVGSCSFVSGVGNLRPSTPSYVALGTFLRPYLSLTLVCLLSAFAWLECLEL